MCKANYQRGILAISIAIFLSLCPLLTLAEEKTNVEEPAEAVTEPESVEGIEINNLTPLDQGFANIPVVPSEDVTKITEPQTTWQKIYPLLIDVGIGIGAALIFLAIWWLVKLKKKENTETK